MKNYLKSVLAMIATFCIFTALSGISHANTVEGISAMPTTQNCGDDDDDEQKKNPGTTQNCSDDDDGEKSKK